MEKKERDLSFEVENSTDLNKMLTGALMDVRRGKMPHEMVKGITLVADKINKNNANVLEYKKISKHKNDIDFFENKEEGAE